MCLARSGNTSFPKKGDKLILETNASDKSEGCNRKVFVRI